MTYSPNIFSTKGGLTRTIVFQWIEAQDVETISKWLAQGEKHPRLALEGIEHAISRGYVDIAQKIWEANWHSPSKTLEGVWRNIAFLNHQASELRDPSTLARYRTHNPKQLDSDQIQDISNLATQWALSKSQSTETSTPFKARNLGLIFGLKAAFEANNEMLWASIVQMRPKLDVSEGNDLFHHILTRIPVWPNPFSHDRKPKAQWVEERALADLFTLGLRPGGSVWVGVASNHVSEPVLDLMLPLAGKLTTPRQRSAILALASEQKAINFDRLFDAFLPLGFPENLSLTPAELKKGDGHSESLYLMDRSHDATVVEGKRYYIDRVLQKPSVSLSQVIGPDKWSSLMRKRLVEVAENVAGSIKSTTTAPKI